MTERFSTWLESLHAQVYPEPITPGHLQITEQMAAQVAPLLPAGGFVLDVGAGQGPALDWFSLHGFQVTGTSLCDEDIAFCKSQGHDVLKCDQNDLDPFPSGIFDCVWARHVLEHSPVPFWALHEFARVLKVGGILYLEMPAPDTACKHVNNRNHYSVLGDNMWQSLIFRSGFDILAAHDLNFTTPAGPDTYHSYTCKKL